MFERTPTNDENCLWLLGKEQNLGELIDAVHEHFGLDSDLNQFRIENFERQFKCFGYDLYDPCDYEWYTTVERI